MNIRFLLALPFLVSAIPCEAQAPLNPPSTSVEAATKVGGEWKTYPTRTLADFPATVTGKVDGATSRFGGRLDKKVAAKGFFYATKVGDRWWLVDPEGALYLNKAVVAVAPQPLSGDALKAKYGDEAGWAKKTDAMLQEYGFNGTGAWTSNELLQGQTPRPVYTQIFNFMSSYGKQRGGTYQQAGHVGYPKDCIFVFDPQFETFCDEFAKQLAANKNDPYLLGTFSDNELPFKRTALRNYLSLEATDPGHIAAEKWLRERHGEKATEADITPQDELDFLAFVVARYGRIVSTAIKKYDPNHLYLGPRLHGQALGIPEVLRAIGPYLDVVALNYYGAWTPNKERLAMWERESKKPVLVTEWYVKGADSGMGNTGGAGWLVKTQADRGKFYQHFALGLLESKVCVGWQWFKYADNDPSNTKADPSNRDSNKGILTANYEPYPPLLDAMRQLNTRVYNVVDYFDSHH